MCATRRSAASCTGWRCASVSARWSGARAGRLGAGLLGRTADRRSRGRRVLALAPTFRWGAMLPAWMLFWICFALLQHVLVRETLPQALGRGVLAAVTSGLAFYAISGIWTNPPKGGPNYLVVPLLVVCVPAGLPCAVLPVRLARVTRGTLTGVVDSTPRGVIHESSLAVRPDGDRDGRGRPRRNTPAAAKVTVPVEYHKLANGLKVVLSRDTSSPTAVRGGLLQHRVPHRAEGPHRVRAPLRAHDVPGIGAPREEWRSSGWSSPTAASSTARRGSTSPTTTRSSRRTPSRRMLWARPTACAG